MRGFWVKRWLGIALAAVLVAGLAARRPGIPWDRLLFSAKEAVYKAWFPLAEVFLDFSQVRVGLGQDGGFTARVLVQAPRRAVPVSYSGRWAIYSGLLVTAIAVGDHGPPASHCPQAAGSAEWTTTWPHSNAVRRVQAARFAARGLPAAP
jgi:hypothetical protein